MGAFNSNFSSSLPWDARAKILSAATDGLLLLSRLIRRHIVWVRRWRLPCSPVIELFPFPRHTLPRKKVEIFLPLSHPPPRNCGPFFLPSPTSLEPPRGRRGNFGGHTKKKSGGSQRSFLGGQRPPPLKILDMRKGGGGGGGKRGGNERDILGGERKGIRAS